MNVLVAEDGPTDRKLIGAMLKRLGFNPMLVADGNRALEFLELNSNVDILLTDIQMPELSGVELIKSVREKPRVRYLPILAVSGVISVSEVAGVLRAGADRYLPKPVQLDKLTSVMRELNRMARNDQAESA